MISIIQVRKLHFCYKVGSFKVKNNGTKPFGKFCQKRFLILPKMRKNIKSGKQTHFAVTQRKGKDYRQFSRPKKTLSTNICSKIVETTGDFDLQE